MMAPALCDAHPNNALSVSHVFTCHNTVGVLKALASSTVRYVFTCYNTVGVLKALASSTVSHVFTCHNTVGVLKALASSTVRSPVQQLIMCLHVTTHVFTC